MNEYEIIYESLQEQLDNGLITYELAEEVNDLAYEKYVVEATAYAKRGYNQKSNGKYTKGFLGKNRDLARGQAISKSISKTNKRMNKMLQKDPLYRHMSEVRNDKNSMYPREMNSLNPRTKDEVKKDLEKSMRKSMEMKSPEQRTKDDVKKDLEKSMRKSMEKSMGMKRLKPVSNEDARKELFR